MNKILIAMAVMASSSIAFAGGNSNNNGPIFGGDTTNNYKVTNQGGKGGQGGAGGTGVGIGVGVGIGKANANATAGAAALNSNKIGVGVNNAVNNKVSNTNLNSLSNKNTNVGINSQGQSLKNVNDLSNRNLNTNVANGGNALSVSKGGNAHQGQSQEQGQQQGQGQMQGQSLDSKQANAQSMTYNEANGMHYSGDYTVRQAPGIVAPSIPPSAGCQKPVTGGLSGTLGGVTFGTTYTDETCIMYEDIRFGMEGDAESRRLANMVIQNRLMGHLEKQDEVAVANKEIADQYASATDEVNIFALTDY